MWTLIPILVLITIAIPSISLLCKQDSLEQNVDNRVKTISNQWNWESESRKDRISHLTDSEEVVNVSSWDIPAAILRGEISRVLVTRSDVLHSLGVPRAGLKLDSAPGRINCVVIEPDRSGELVGSCYELCGTGHRSIPIHFLVI